MKDYLQDNFDSARIVDVFDELPLWSAPFGLKLLDYINYRSNISALDIGFGTGFPLTEVAMRLGQSCTVYGIDPWKEVVERTKAKLDLYHIKNVQLLNGIAEDLPFSSSALDLIVSNNGINNVNDLEQTFSECSRVMKQGGQFVFTLNMPETMFEFYDALESVLSEMGLYKEIETMRSHIKQKRPDADTIKSLLYRNSFLVKDQEFDQFNYHFVNGTAMLNHYFIRFAFMSSWKKLIPEDKLELVFDKIETNLNRQASLTGGLKLSIPYLLVDAIKI